MEPVEPCFYEATGLVAFQHVSSKRPIIYCKTYLQIVTEMSPLICVLTFWLLTRFSIWNDRKTSYEFTGNGAVLLGQGKYRLTHLGIELHGGPLHFDCV